LPAAPRQLFAAAISRGHGTALLSGLLIASVYAQPHPTQYVATVWQSDEGLPQNSVYGIVQDDESYLWIATWGWLARFDGVRFRVFGSAEVPGLGSGVVLSLSKDRSGALWIGTRNGTVTRLQKGAAVTYAQRDGLPGKLVESVRNDAQGKAWVNTSGGIARLSGDKLEVYPTHQGKAVSEFYLQARDGSMWFRSGEDILRFGADGRTTSVRIPKPGRFLVHEAGDGSVWVAPQYHPRLLRYHRGVFSEVPLPGASHIQWTGELRQQGVLAMAADTDGELLLLTPAGFVRAVGGRLGPPEVVALPPSIGASPRVLSLLVDREGNRWVGTYSTGLFRFRRAPLTAYAGNEGLSDSQFGAVFQDREGRVWLGGDSLFWFDGSRFCRFPGVADIRAVAQTRDGDLWFGGSGGLYRWRSGVLSRFKIQAPAVNRIYQDQEGTLWITAPSYERPGGLYALRDEKLEFIAADVNAFTEDRDGGLWLTSRKGIGYMRGGKTTLYPSNLFTVPGILQDSTRTLWIATYGGGLNRFRDGRFSSITTKDGLANDRLVSILEDGTGNLWVGSDHNIFRLSVKELNDLADGKTSSIWPISYGAAEGMRSSECIAGSPGAWKTTDGRIWFPTVRGVVAIDPEAGDRLPPPVVLEEAWANQLRIGVGGASTVPPGNDTFDFQFTALSLSAADKQHFKYRLDPFDKDWVDAGTQRTAHYTNMAPGAYSFHVIAANSFGIWNEQGARVDFVLQPRFYQTSWFYAFCFLTFLALIWVAHQFRLWQLKRAFNVRLEERVEERTRIARELHDTLLQSFQGALYRFQAARNLFSRRPEEALKTLDAAITSAENALAEGRDAIQNLRPGSVQRSLEELLAATGQELRDDQHGHTPSATFQVNREGQPRTLSPLVQDEIYRIAREVLRNAYHHAGACRIEAAIQYDPDLFRLRIRDDGKGIDPVVLQEGARPGHFGLPGIRERAERIGAQLRLWSEGGAGTEVELSVPAAVAYATSRVRRRLRLFPTKTKGT
jgi:signal transduction histidine kinase/ligand-binding sensor domain-containing protein